MGIVEIIGGVLLILVSLVIIVTVTCRVQGRAWRAGR
jgi:uncharacterized membrane protein